MATSKPVKDTVKRFDEQAYWDSKEYLIKWEIIKPGFP